MGGPLAGIRVLEFSQVIAAPYAGQFLVDLGADVIKVEPPEGDSWRLQGSFAPAESKSFQLLNRGKRDLTLRLDRPEARAIVAALVPQIDVVLINYRPDVPAKFGIDYAALRALRNDLIYVDLTAFGRRGPWALRPGYDGVVQAVSGLMAAEGKLRADGAPATIVSTAIADYCTGMVMADAVLAALWHRERTGEGQLVECSLLATALNLQGAAVLRGRAATAEDDACERCYLVADGAIALCATTRTQQTALRGLWGASAADGATYYRARSEVEALAELAALHIPAVALRFAEEMAADPQTRANALLVDVVHNSTGPQNTIDQLIRFSAAQLPPLRAAPPLGRDTDALLTELGYDETAIDDLRARGVLA